jgi:hypothetical protein
MPRVQEFHIAKRDALGLQGKARLSHPTATIQNWTRSVDVQGVCQRSNGGSSSGKF